MKLIATHNSGTGERSRNWLFSLMTPFARCQDLNITGQYNAGCNYFDLRVRWIDNDWRICHGLWQSDRTLSDVLDELTYLSFEANKPFITIFYEGRFPSDYMQMAFLDDMHEYKKEYPQIEFVIFGVKKPEWTNLVVLKDVPYISKFPKILGWKALIPIPRFWNQFVKYEFNEEKYTMIDFLTPKQD